VSEAQRFGLLVAAPLGVEAIAVRSGAPGVRVVRTGMGPRRAARAAARIEREAAEVIAVAGVCGALDPGFEPGDLVVASALIGPDGARIELSSAGLAAALERAGLRAHSGAIACVARLSEGRPRAELARRTGACAVDMESIWLAPAAAGRPFVVLRAVSDGPRHEFWRPAIVTQGIAALRSLRRAAPILVAWAADVPVIPAPIPSAAPALRHAQA
jgi:4-hydroxy-3-methylbut-2-enyl diphosphate reductase